MKHRSAIVIIVMAFVIALFSGARPSHADAPFYYLLNSIHAAQCTNSTYSFFSNDYYSTPASGDLARITQRITIGGTTTISYSGYFQPYWAAHPGGATVFGSGVFWASNYYYLGYSVPAGTAYYISFQLIYRGVPGGVASSSYVTFKCSGDTNRQMTLLSLDNQKTYSNY
jgi:hypothetical protein